LRQLKLKIDNWPIAGSFTISRSSVQHITVVTVIIRENGHMGRGECRPYARYGETAQSVSTQIEAIRSQIEKGITTDELQSVMPAGAARNAIDCALWDLKAKQTKESISELLGLLPPKPRISAYTLSIDTPDNMRVAAHKAQNYPLLKIKIGHENGLESCLAVMDVRPDAQLIIDANEALHPNDVTTFRKALHNKPVVMIEQPVADNIYDQIPNQPTNLPIFCADESLHTHKDLGKLWNAGYRAVNIKLDKCGGLTAGLNLMKSAKERGFIIMAGCMVGTSLAMAPMMILESFADYIDLDGPLLLSKDIKNGMVFDGPIINPPIGELWG